MNRLRPLLFALLALVLAACAATPGIPDTTYYRLPPRESTAALPAPLFDVPIVVDTLVADGLHSDQALIYALDSSAIRLRAYHYQLWVDPPVRMLQRRLTGSLRQARAAPLVADRLPAQVDRVRIGGRLEAFERIPREDGGWDVLVAMVLRVDAPGSEVPLLVRAYRQRLPADSDTVHASVLAIGQALDRLLADFHADLAAAVADD